MKNKKLYVYYQKTLVGTLAITASKLVAFEYDDKWIETGFSISPFSLPLKKEVFIPNKNHFEGLFGVFDDSLPDAWGRLLLDRSLKHNNIKKEDINVLDKLSLIGKTAMGALEYVPSIEVEKEYNDTNYDELSIMCLNILKHKEVNDLDLDLMFKIGGSSGGARPKALIKYNSEDYIIKFSNHIDNENSGEIEYSYSICAKKCGIDMTDTILFESNLCSGYFGIKRFDINNKKIHMISAAALLEVDYREPLLDYNDLFKLTKIVTNNNKSDVIELYRRMVFNVLTHNLDDHSKNFSYLYNEELRIYRLSPAYDITYSTTCYNEHTTSVNNKGSNITKEDLISVGKKASLSKSLCEEIYELIKKNVEEDLNKYINII